MAVATPKGLVVPVLRNVQDMNYADIEKGIADLGEKAKKNQLSVEDMDGGTFTISNGGVFGSLFGTPIINPPQSAILGMHGTFERPVVRNGQVIIALANSDSLLASGCIILHLVQNPVVREFFEVTNFSNEIGTQLYYNSIKEWLALHQE